MDLRAVRVLVTGGTGYVGRHAVRVLLERGATVRVLSRSLVDLPAGVELALGDVCHARQVRRAIAGCQAVLHLAASPLAQSAAYPLHDFRVNALGTLLLLRAAAGEGTERFIYASSSAVYGLPGAGPVGEDCHPMPRSPYGASKLCGEIYCHTFGQTEGLAYTIFRLFNVLGVPLDERPRPTVDARFIRRALAGQAPIIDHHPGNSFDFVDVRDVAEALVRALERDATIGQVCNIAAGHGISLNELALAVCRVVGLSLRPIIRDPRPAPIVWEADTSRLRALLDLQPRSCLDGPLQESVEWFRRRALH